jgi:hypothetical protein
MPESSIAPFLTKLQERVKAENIVSSVDESLCDFTDLSPACLASRKLPQAARRSRRVSYWQGQRPFDHFGR